MGIDRGACGRPTRGLYLTLLFVGLVAAALFLAPGGMAAIYTVNSPADPGNGPCTLLECTLHDAIVAANANAGADDINFDIGIGGSFTIFPSTDLPRIDDSVTIDATTQTGYIGAPLITIDGTNATNANGFEVNTSGTTIRGFAIGGFTSGSGILLDGVAGNNTIAGNYIGIDAGGGTANPNVNGITVQTSSNTIGGVTVGGGGSAPDRNVISGNAHEGIAIGSGVSNTVQGNYIGLDASGSFAVPNQHGIVVQSDGNDIGTTNQPWPNVVSGNSSVGIEIASGSDNAVFANYVGTDADGRSAVPNGAGGVQVIGSNAVHADGNRIGESEGGGNIVSGNTGSGVIVNGFGTGAFANGNDIEANSIGIDVDGNPLGNSGAASAGVLITTGAGDGNTVGSVSPSGGGNTIANNGGPGVEINVGVGQSVAQNEISNNGGIGIDLAPSGVTDNDTDDTDTGANDLLNFPDIGGVTRLPGGSVSLTGSYDGGTAGATYRLDFYASSACDASANGEGEHWLGTITTEPASGSGDATFATGTSLSTYVAPGSAVTATATDAAGSTSEFSKCVAVNGNTGPDFIVNTTADTDDASCDPSPGDCTLREAINAANADPNLNTIKFALPDPPFKITVTDPTAFPEIDQDVIIDGDTQSGTPGSPVVQLDGSAQSTTSIGLDVQGGLDGSTIRGLSVTGFKRAGIRLEGPPSVVEGSYLGLAPNGAVAGNGSGSVSSDGGIIINSDHNLIGGSTPATRNVISGNDGNGVHFDSNGFESVLQGNYVGTTTDGLAGAPNTGNGIRFEDTEAQIIGGSKPGEGNLISGNTGDGVSFNSGSNWETGTFEGNTVGLAKDGVTALANQAAGMRLNGVDDVHIGGTQPGAGNVISRNAGEAIVVDFGSTGTRIQGNRIGTTADGLAPAPNADAASSQVLLNNGATQTLIGGTTPAARNVIAGHSNNVGVYFTGGSDDNVVQGNYIGLGADGSTALGNGDGVRIDGSSADNTIGGVVPGAGNVISGNSLDAVDIDTAGSGNKVLGNTIGPDPGETTVANLGNDVGVQVTNTSGTTVGSTSPGAGNVIGGSFDSGVLIFGSSSSTTVAGNFIGTNRSDTLDLGNDDGHPRRQRIERRQPDRAEQRHRAQRRLRDRNGQRRPEPLLGQLDPRQRRRGHPPAWRRLEQRPEEPDDRDRLARGRDDDHQRNPLEQPVDELLRRVLRDAVLHGPAAGQDLPRLQDRHHRRQRRRVARVHEHVPEPRRCDHGNGDRRGHEGHVGVLGVRDRDRRFHADRPRLRREHRRRPHRRRRLHGRRLLTARGDQRGHRRRFPARDDQVRDPGQRPAADRGEFAPAGDHDAGDDRRNDATGLQRHASDRPRRLRLERRERPRARHRIGRIDDQRHRRSELLRSQLPAFEEHRHPGSVRRQRRRGVVRRNEPGRALRRSK